MASISLDESLIIYEDTHLIITNKPSDLLVHHSHYARNIREISLTQLIRAHCKQKIHPIHRLDRKTSGAVLFAKSAAGAKELQSQFKDFSIQKDYIALVRGHYKAEGIINSPIKNDESGLYQEAETHFTTLEQVVFKKAVTPYPSSRYSLLLLRPKTGRTHQLRKHMNKIAHPIIGDPKHGNRHHNHAFQEWFGHTHLFLHARTLSFTHPVTSKEITSVADFPDFWKGNLNTLGFKLDLERL